VENGEERGASGRQSELDRLQNTMVHGNGLKRDKLVLEIGDERGIMQCCFYSIMVSHVCVYVIKTPVSVRGRSFSGAVRDSVRTVI